MRKLLEATVVTAGEQSILVEEIGTGLQVQVFAANAGQFAVGDRVTVFYTGDMSTTNPPQVAASCVVLYGQGWSGCQGMPCHSCGQTCEQEYEAYPCGGSCQDCGCQNSLREQFGAECFSQLYARYQAFVRRTSRSRSCCTCCTCCTCCCR